MKNFLLQIRFMESMILVIWMVNIVIYLSCRDWSQAIHSATIFGLYVLFVASCQLNRKYEALIGHCQMAPAEKASGR